MNIVEAVDSHGQGPCGKLARTELRMLSLFSNLLSAKIITAHPDVMAKEITTILSQEKKKSFVII